MVHHASNRQRINNLTRLCLVVVILAAGLLPLVSHSPLRAQTAPDPRFGAVEAFRDPDSARDLNLGWERILFYWSELHPNDPDDWNIFHVEDGWISTALANGRQVIGLLENTPRWATDGGNHICGPRGEHHDNKSAAWTITAMACVHGANDAIPCKPEVKAARRAVIAFMVACSSRRAGAGGDV